MFQKLWLIEFKESYPHVTIVSALTPGGAINKFTRKRPHAYVESINRYIPMELETKL